MQNTVSNYINHNVINIKSEVLFREAEDDLYYFNNLRKAELKLKQAIEYTPSHIKSIILYADIYFLKGNFKKAVSLYLTANNLKQYDFKIIASIANCYNALRNYYESLKYCNDALSVVKNDNFALYTQVIELKINNLIALGKYEDANRTFLQSRELLRQNLISSIYDSLNEKIKIHQKLSFSGLKIV